MRAAIFQGDTAGLTPAARLDRLRAAAQEARADLLLCPELYLSGYGDPDAVRARAEPADGPFAAAVSRIARETGTAIVYGYPEAAPEGVYNAARCIDAGGRAVANHRKLVIPPGIEQGVFLPGRGLTLATLGGLRCAVLICYDLEFPEAARAAAAAGAEAILAPTALMDRWGAVAERVIPARAFENGVHVLYANHAGREAGIGYLGRSCILGPEGQDLARAGTGPGVIAADLDPRAVAAAQARLPYLSDVTELRARLG